MNALILFFIICASIAHAAAPEQEVDKALASAQKEKAVAQTWEGQHADKPYVALLSEYEITVNEDWSFQEVYHARVKIQQESAKELGQWPIYYNKSREDIIRIQAFVETPQGKRLEATDIKDLPVYEKDPLYADMRVKMVTMPQVDVGCVIDVRVTTKARKEIPNQFWDQVPLPVIPTKLAKHTYIIPEDKKVIFKAVNSNDKPQVEHKDGMVTYSFSYQETGYLQEEEMMPPADDVVSRVFLSSIPDWKTVVSWYSALIEKNTVAETDITVKALELAKDKKTQKEKARAIVEFIQDNFRYVSLNFGDHLIEPHPSNEVFKNGYGDAKDLALLARQMLLLAGIDTHLCLFVNEYNGDPQNGLPNPSVFEHVILEITVDGERYFADPQTKGFDFGQWPTVYDNAHLLIIEYDNDRFDHVPVSKEEDNAIRTTSDISISPDGSAVFEVKVKMSVEGSQSFREAWGAQSGKNKDKFFERLEANFTQGGTMIKRDVRGLENRYGLVEFDLTYGAPNAYPIVNNMILLKENDQQEIPEFAEIQRTYPIFTPSNTLMQDTNTYHVPDGFAVDSMPENYHLSIDFMEISADYRRDGEKVVTNRLLRIKRNKLPPQRYPEVRDFRRQIAQKSDKYIILKAKSQTTPEAKEWINKQ